MSQIIDELRAAYSPWGIEIEGVTTYGTYYRLRCGRCGATVGLTGDHLLRGMAQEVVDLQAELYASGLMGCKCGYQLECARTMDVKPRDRIGAAS
jgi:hypothetical protein